MTALLFTGQNAAAFFSCSSKTKSFRPAAGFLHLSTSLRLPLKRPREIGWISSIKRLISSSPYPSEDPALDPLLKAMDENKKNLTVDEALQQSLQYLQSRNIPEAQISTTNIISKILDLDWSSGYRDLQRILDTSNTKSSNPLALTELTPKQVESLRDMLLRRANHEPLQYILGQWDFLDYTLEIQAPLLCPRPETEELVDMVAMACQKKYPNDLSSTVNILDIGCGTGAIGIALADMLPNAHITAIDIDPIAIEVSNRNAKKILGSSGAAGRYQAILSSIDDFQPMQPFHVIVSNPPYIPERDAIALEKTVVEYESHDALFSGEDGLDVIRSIVKRLPDLGAADCWMEVDPSHPELIQRLLEKDGDMEYHETRKDMFGLDRFVHIRMHRRRPLDA